MSPSSAEVASAALTADLAADPTAATPRRWFYTQNGEHYGPVSGIELRAAAQLEFLGPADRVKCGVNGRWVTARDVDGLFARSSPLPSSSSSQ